jgi:hypothetical protein
MRVSAIVVFVHLVSIEYIAVGPTEAKDLNFSFPPVIGVGNQSCESWPIDILEKDSESSPYVQWILGIASGQNLFDHSSRRSIFFPYDENNIVSFISNYCRKNPGKLISEAAYDFLIGRMDPG